MFLLGSECVEVYCMLYMCVYVLCVHVCVNDK